MPAVLVIKSGLVVGYDSNNDLARLVELRIFCSAEEGHHVSINFKSKWKIVGALT